LFPFSPQVTFLQYTKFSCHKCVSKNVFQILDNQKTLSFACSTHSFLTSNGFVQITCTKENPANAYVISICRLLKIIIYAVFVQKSAFQRSGVLSAFWIKKESLDLQGFLDGSGDRIQTNDTPGMKRLAPASGRLILQQKT